MYGCTYQNQPYVRLETVSLLVRIKYIGLSMPLILYQHPQFEDTLFSSKIDGFMLHFPFFIVWFQISCSIPTAVDKIDLLNC
jgi:hypothetical protein